MPLNLFSNSGLKFGCDQMISSFGEHNKRSTLLGNAYVISEELDIRSNHIEIFGEDYRFAEAKDGVTINNEKEKYVITADKLFYDNDKKEATVTGNTIMRDEKNEMIIRGDYIKTYQETSITLIQIKVRIITEDLICRSDFAMYNSKENTLVLTGDPIVYKNDDEFKASRIEINLDNNDIVMKGRVKGSITEEEKDNDTETIQEKK